MLRKTTKACSIAALVLCCAAFAFGQTDDPGSAGQIDRLFSPYGPSTPGVAVAVIKDGRVVCQKGYGMANLEHDVPITTRTVFNAASVSKQFTAFAIYLLEQQGRLSLEDDVRTHLAEMPDFGWTIRIRHLLAHTSGLKDPWALLALAGWRMDDVITTPQVLRVLWRQKELNFEPGSRYLYGNAGYTLLAEIVRRRSGQTFAEFTRKNIFEPLGMHDTQFCEDHEAVLRGRAESYEMQQGSRKRMGLANSVAGPSNLWTTVEDMAKWALNFETPRVGDADLLQRFNAPSLLDNGERAVYYADGDDIGYHAKGQVVRRYRGANVWSHGGHTAGFRSTFWRFPDQRFALVLLSNDEHFAQLQNAEGIVDFCLNGSLQPKPEIVVPRTRAVPSTARPSADLKDYEGRFCNDELEADYTVESRNGRLFLSHLRHGALELTGTGRDQFTGKIQFPVEIAFARDEGGRSVTGFAISNFGAKNVRFAKAK